MYDLRLRSGPGYRWIAGPGGVLILLMGLAGTIGMAVQREPIVVVPAGIMIFGLLLVGWSYGSQVWITAAEVGWRSLWWPTRVPLTQITTVIPHGYADARTVVLTEDGQILVPASYTLTRKDQARFQAALAERAADEEAELPAVQELTIDRWRAGGMAAALVAYVCVLAWDLGTAGFEGPPLLLFQLPGWTVVVVAGHWLARSWVHGRLRLDDDGLHFRRWTGWDRLAWAAMKERTIRSGPKGFPVEVILLRTGGWVRWDRRRLVVQDGRRRHRVHPWFAPPGQAALFFAALDRRTAQNLRPVRPR